MSHSRARATRMPESPAASVRASHVALMPSPSQLLDLLPPAGAWTTEDYLWLTRDTNQLIELADGRLETLPMPTVTHQLVLKRLLWALDAYLQARGGLVLFAPLKLRLAPGRFREPDILALLDQADARLGEQFWTGADLVVEILSASNRDHDLLTKRVEYAAAGIEEYWLADPDTRTLTVLVLDGDRYREHGQFGVGQAATSPLMSELSLELVEVFGR
ncbi:MAG: Uma2 family endonuclease [Ardenticatenia bacterium]|nr:Uma2 family endonuclease [Ardenticatenia bacterium]